MSEKILPATITPTIRYEVLKPFKYGGRTLRPGDEFIPNGGRFDAQLIATGKFVGRIESHNPRRRWVKGK